MKSVNNYFFVKVDAACDYIPVVSTASNLIDLFQKCVILPLMNKQSIANNHYYTYLKEKNVSRCLVLLIPVIGNIIIKICDYRKFKLIQKDPSILKKIE